MPPKIENSKGKEIIETDLRQMIVDLVGSVKALQRRVQALEKRPGLNPEELREHRIRHTIIGPGRRKYGLE